MWKSSKKRLHARSRKPPIAPSDDGNYSAFLRPAQAQRRVATITALPRIC
jgi:hypothetical protein